VSRNSPKFEHKVEAVERWRLTLLCRSMKMSVVSTLNALQDLQVIEDEEDRASYSQYMCWRRSEELKVEIVSMLELLDAAQYRHVCMPL
jgi:hypothetical protein